MIGWITDPVVTQTGHEQQRAGDLPMIVGVEASPSEVSLDLIGLGGRNEAKWSRRWEESRR